MQIRMATPQSFDTTKVIPKLVPRTDSFPVGDPAFRVRVTSTQPDTDGTTVTVKHAGEVIGRGTISGGVALVLPTKRTDGQSLTISLERDGFISRELNVPAPITHLTVTCPQSVNAPQETNIAVTGSLSPAIAGGTIKFRATHPNGTVTTQSTTTNSSSTWGIKIPVGSSEFGTTQSLSTTHGRPWSSNSLQR